MKDTREFIIKTSLALFMQKGFKAVTMNEIVKKTGLSKGAVYHYFESKEQVFEETVKHFYNHLMITDYSDFPRTTLKAFYRFYMKKLETLPDFDDATNILVFFSDAIRKIPTFAQINNAQRKKEISAWTNIISIAKENGEIKADIPDRIIARMFLNLSDGIALNQMIISRQSSSNDMKQEWDYLYALLKKE